MLRTTGADAAAAEPNSNRDWLVALLILAFLVAALWVLFIPRDVAIADVWDVWARMDAHEFMFYQHDSRPFIFWPLALAYTLNASSFVWTEVIFAALLFLKGVAFYALLRQLIPRNAALVAAALSIVFPSDQGIMYTGAPNGHLGVFTYLLALLFLLSYCRRPRLLTLIGMWMSLIVTLGVYETVYPLVLFGPALLIGYEGRLSKRLLKPALAWYAVLALALLRLGLLSITMGSLGPRAEAMLLSTSMAAPDQLRDMLNSLLRLYTRHFWAGWAEVFEYGPFRRSSPLFIMAIFVGAVFVIALWGLGRREPQENQLKNRQYWYLIVGALVAMGLGFIAYLPSLARNDLFRTFIYVLPSAALAVSLVLYGISSLLPWKRYRYVVFALLSAGSITLGTLRTLDFHYAATSDAYFQKTFVRQMVEQAPGIQDNVVMLVVDETNDAQALRTFYFIPPNLSLMLKVTYEEPTLSGYMCQPSSLEDSPQFPCVFDESGVGVSLSEGAPPTHIPYEHLVVFRYRNSEEGPIFEPSLEDFTTTGAYHPEALIDFNAPLPPRTATLLDAVPPFNRLTFREG
jgi:hypothetical protein